MSIRPIDFNGMVQRTHDVGTVKQQEDNKPIMEQQALVGKMQKDTEQIARQVNHSEDAQNQKKKYDARDKGSNEYHGQRGAKRSKEDKKQDGKVVRKSAPLGFDIKI